MEQKVKSTTCQPSWCSRVLPPCSRGAIAGLTLKHGRGHVFRALLESVCYGTEHVLEAMRAAGQAQRPCCCARQAADAESGCCWRACSMAHSMCWRPCGRQACPAGYTGGRELGAALHAFKPGSAAPFKALPTFPIFSCTPVSRLRSQRNPGGGRRHQEPTLAAGGLRLWLGCCCSCCTQHQHPTCRILIVTCLPLAVAQIHADVSNLPLRLTAVGEASVLGSAILAGWCRGLGRPRADWQRMRTAPGPRACEHWGAMCSQWRASLPRTTTLQPWQLACTPRERPQRRWHCAYESLPASFQTSPQPLRLACTPAWRQQRRRWCSLGLS